MSAFAYVPMPGYGLMPVRQCLHCRELFVVLETAQHFPNYCPGKDCRQRARSKRQRAAYAEQKDALKIRRVLGRAA